MKRIIQFGVLSLGLVLFGTGCLERKREAGEAGGAPVVSVDPVDEPVPVAPEVDEGAVEDADERPKVEDDAKVAAAIAAAKAKRMAELDPQAPIAVSLGLHEDGEVIVEWKEGLNYSVKNEGSANEGAGATVVAKFGNGFDKFDLTLDLVVKVAGGERLVVSGSYEATVPFQVTLLGSGETSDQAEGLSGEAGSGPFDYVGDVPVFFEVLRTE